MPDVGTVNENFGADEVKVVAGEDAYIDVAVERPRTPIAPFQAISRGRECP